MSLLIALLLFGFSNEPTVRLSEQSVCPGENERSRAAVIRYATGQTRSTRHPEVPIVHESEIRLLTDRSHVDVYYCENLARVIASYRQDNEGLNGYDMSYYYAGGMYYAVAVPMNPVVTQTGPGTLSVDLRYLPVFIVRPNLEVLTVAAL